MKISVLYDQTATIKVFGFLKSFQMLVFFNYIWGGMGGRRRKLMGRFEPGVLTSHELHAAVVVFRQMLSAG